MALKLLVGLGNPGPQYDGTRHNAGFWWIDRVAQLAGAALAPEKGFYANLAKVNIGGQPVWLMQPMTFMNKSGQAVGAMARFYRIEPQEILVVHDELDLRPGQVKLKFAGSHAGHNGLKDIQAHLGTPDYWRLRLGVGHPGVKAEVINWVLGKPSAEDRQAIDQAIEHTLGALPQMLSGQMDLAMRHVHTQPLG
ncbi:peptidyl-tRNA hydrolase [Lampropedia cohaerens]|uniref:Peptidyl-tRNA hydrolase n=1 Tax=Lampropedia cohaerens TaxID=1610491 RepID=A0A0U1PYH6_9BURK|nr:aminoacyl-tRNA hydrolase [Lampropedia cohaerens]KKW67583.1 peptidyl-tRNA hydrolase [Lampropedia cohaerens]